MTSVNDLKNNFHMAMHAMGSYHKLTYTNSREAFLYWYERGMRIFEVDLAETADKQFVCIAHHVAYKDLKRVGISDIPANPDNMTAQWFLSQRLFPYLSGGLAPLSLENLIDLLKRYDDLILMLDLFGQFERRTIENFSQWIRHLAGEDISVISRLLIETYSKEMTTIISEQVPSVHIIYGIDDAAGEDNRISVKQIKEMGIEFVSFPWHYFVKYPGKLNELTDNGLTVFSRTIDNLRADTLKRAGVNVILLDTHYATTKARIYYTRAAISGVLFLQLARAKLMDFFHSMKKKSRRRKA